MQSSIKLNLTGGFSAAFGDELADICKRLTAGDGFQPVFIRAVPFQKLSGGRAMAGSVRHPAALLETERITAVITVNSVFSSALLKILGEHQPAVLMMINVIIIPGGTAVVIQRSGQQVGLIGIDGEIKTPVLPFQAVFRFDPEPEMRAHIPAPPLYRGKHRKDPARFVGDHLVVICMQIAGIFWQIPIHGTAHLVEKGNGQIKVINHINAGFLSERHGHIRLQTAP